MERWAPHTPQLDVRSHFNLTLNTSAATETPWAAQNGTRSLIASLQLAQVQQLRTMHLTLGAFSLALALLTVYLILSDAKRVAAVQATLRRQSFSSLRNVHPAETFPLVLACGAVTQQIIFVSVQGASLRSILSDQCRGIAMITFPGIFIMGYITLIFGIEMAMRATSFERFSPRGKWNTTVCIGVISFLVLLTWMPTIAWPMYNRCFGSLIFFAFRYELIALSVMCILIFSFLVLAALITIQLMRTPDIDPNERIAASRMTYYLILAAMVYILVLPLEIQALNRNFMNALATSRIAEVSLFSSGMVIAFLHLFLRANATRMVIKPIEEMKSQTKQKRPKIRLFGPSDLELQISGPLALQGGRRPDSRQGLIDVGPEKNRYDFEPGYFVRPEKPLSPVSMKSQALIDSTKWPLPPDPVQTGFASEPQESTSGLHQRNKSNYSLFPTRAEDIPRLPATVYKPPKAGDEGSRLSKLAMRRQIRRSSLGDTKSVTDVSEAFSFLAKPMPLFSKHRRGESTDSSATVQIGLRFSVAPATLAAAKCTKAEREADLPSPPPLARDNSDSSGTSLGLPIQAPSRGPTPSAPKDTEPVAFPLPPRNVSPTPGKTPAFPVLSASNSGAYLQAQREKVLPPTPHSAMPAQPPPTQAPTQLSGLRMNPVTPAASVTSPTSSSPVSTPTTPVSAIRSNSLKSAAALSPTSRIPLGAGTMARSPPPNGWI